MSPFFVDYISLWYQFFIIKSLPFTLSKQNVVYIHLPLPCK